MIDFEEWRPVVDWEGYEVSDQGNIKRVPCMVNTRWGARLLPKKPRILKPWAGRYPQVHLSNGSRKYRANVHVLVLEAFVGPCPEGMEACHLNDVGSDNRLVNLRWDTRSANHVDAISNGRNVRASKSHCVQGHEFTPENTCLSQEKGRRPRRKCRQCGRERAAIRRGLRRGIAA